MSSFCTTTLIVQNRIGLTVDATKTADSSSIASTGLEITRGPAYLLRHVSYHRGFFAHFA
jgi:hypothetical protein